MNTRKKYYDLEKILKGVSNHRRIEMLELVSGSPGLSTEEIIEKLGINYQTGALHVRKLVQSGLLSAYRDGNFMRHEVSGHGRSIMELLKKLK